MKKKIKDLTDEEIDRICNKHGSCWLCPLGTKSGGCVFRYLESEVEIDESNND